MLCKNILIKSEGIRQQTGNTLHWSLVSHRASTKHTQKKKQWVSFFWFINNLHQQREQTNSQTSQTAGIK